MGELLYNFTAAPRQAPEIREGAASIEMRIGEVPTLEIARNQEQSAIELRFVRVNAQYAWALMEVWPTKENLVAGDISITLSDAFTKGLAAFMRAKQMRNLPNRGYAWAVLDLWTSFTRDAMRRHTSIQRDEHVLQGGAGCTTPRDAFEAALSHFQQFLAVQKG